MNDFRSNLAKELKDPVFEVEYEKLEMEYQLKRALIEARLKKGMTQADVAKKAGISQVMVARIESGNSNPTIQTLHKVLVAVGKRLKLVNV